MRLSHLKGVFSNLSSIESIKDVAKDEVDYYTKMSLKKGSSMPVIIEEDTDLYIERKDIIKLCKAYLEGLLSEDYVYYVVDVLTMSSKAMR